MFRFFKSKPRETALQLEKWIDGRAFVYAENGEVEYFMNFQEWNNIVHIRSYNGALRELKLCRTLDYVCNPKHIKYNYKKVEWIR